MTPQVCSVLRLLDVSLRQAVLVVDGLRLRILDVVHRRIVPLLTLARAENHVESRTDCVNRCGNDENYSPLADGRLLIKVEKKLNLFISANDSPRLTLPSMMLPATMGARRPKKLAKQLVNDIRMPAKRGVRSR